nr:putative zinc finger, CCHC-type [Tanacetum cinerariifolium]
MSLVPVKVAGSMSYQVPVLTATNYPVWAIKVKSVMDAYGLWGTVEPRALDEEPDAKKSKQALSFLFQAIPEDMVLQMASYTDPKQVWDGLKTRFLGVERVRTARLTTLKRELESLRMKEGESVDDFASKLSGLASKARSLGYELEEVDSVKRLLDSMPKSFLQIVASIEQCFELDSMLFDEAVGRLKAYEERIKGVEKMEDTQGGLLLASDGKSHGCKHCGGGSSNRDDFGRGRGRGRGSVRDRDGTYRTYLKLVEKLHRLALQLVADGSDAGSVKMTYTSLRATDDINTPLFRNMIASRIWNEERDTLGGTFQKPLEIIVRIANVESRFTSAVCKSGDIKLQGRAKVLEYGSR